jgi:hypothetical protein
MTDHELVGENKEGNAELRCKKCGNPKMLIQGFDADLM